jgi:hypothetical protein
MLIRPSRWLLKKRHNLSKRKDTDLWSLDECHFQQHGTRVAMWVPPEEKDPVILLAPTRKSVALFGAVNVNDGRLVTRFEKQFDAMTFKAFLIQLLRHKKKGKRIVVMLDNARYHHAKILQGFLRKNRNALRLEFLPAYSPELNPIERVWKVTRKICTHNVYFEKLEQVTDSVAKQHAVWKKPNETLRRLCCIT